MGGPEGSTAMEFADVLGNLSRSCGYETKTHVTVGALENLMAVRNRVNTQFGFIQADVLEYLRAYESEDPEIASAVAGLNIAFPLFDQEVHILARDNVKDLKDLEGKRVSIGAPDSGEFLTATVIFDLLGYGPKHRVTLGPRDALSALSEGTIDAMFLVDGAPSLLLAQQGKLGDGIHLLNVTDPILEIAYSPTVIDPGTYSFQDEEVKSVSVRTVVITYDYKLDGDSAYAKQNCDRVSDIAYLTKDRLEAFRDKGHPKWKDVDLGHEIIDWDVSACVARGFQESYELQCK